MISSVERRAFEDRAAEREMHWSIWASRTVCWIVKSGTPFTLDASLYPGKIVQADVAHAMAEFSDYIDRPIYETIRRGIP